LSEVVTDVLIERGDTRVVRCVARNSRVRISLPGYDRLIVRAREDRILALTVADRRDLPRQCYIKLIENASASVRERLQSAHPEFAGKSKPASTTWRAVCRNRRGRCPSCTGSRRESWAGGCERERRPKPTCTQRPACTISRRRLSCSRR
jgi:hypothetical protein